MTMIAAVRPLSASRRPAASSAAKPTSGARPLPGSQSRRCVSRGFGDDINCHNKAPASDESDESGAKISVLRRLRGPRAPIPRNER